MFLNGPVSVNWNKLSSKEVHAPEFYLIKKKSENQKIWRRFTWKSRLKNIDFQGKDDHQGEYN